MSASTETPACGAWPREGEGGSEGRKEGGKEGGREGHLDLVARVELELPQPPQRRAKCQIMPLRSLCATKQYEKCWGTAKGKARRRCLIAKSVAAISKQMQIFHALIANATVHVGLNNERAIIADRINTSHSKPFIMIILFSDLLIRLSY